MFREGSPGETCVSMGRFHGGCVTFARGLVGVNMGGVICVGVDPYKRGIMEGDPLLGSGITGCGGIFSRVGGGFPGRIRIVFPLRGTASLSCVSKVRTGTGKRTEFFGRVGVILGSVLWCYTYLVLGR